MADSRGVVSHKLVLVGDTGVGKTCIASKFVRDDFHDTVQSTVGGAQPLHAFSSSFSAAFPPSRLPLTRLLSVLVYISDRLCFTRVPISSRTLPVIFASSFSRPFPPPSQRPSSSKMCHWKMLRLNSRFGTPQAKVKDLPVPFVFNVVLSPLHLVAVVQNGIKALSRCTIVMPPLVWLCSPSCPE